MDLQTKKNDRKECFLTLFFVGNDYKVFVKKKYRKAHVLFVLKKNPIFKIDILLLSKTKRKEEH